MTQIVQPDRTTILVAMLFTSISGTALSAEYPVAGTAPHQRLAGAPVITSYPKNADWYQQALYGVSRPYPPSLRFLEDQEAWHTPFRQPGMLAPYDIRGWHPSGR